MAVPGFGRGVRDSGATARIITWFKGRAPDGI